MYKTQDGETRAKTLKEMSSIDLKIVNNPQCGWELSTALADKENKKGLAGLIFNVDNSQSYMDIFIWATKKDMYKKYGSSKRCEIEIENKFRDSLSKTKAETADIYVENEFDTEEYYTIKIYSIIVSTYLEALDIINACTDVVASFYKKDKLS